MNELTLSEMRQIERWKEFYFEHAKSMPKKDAADLLLLHTKHCSDKQRAKVMLRARPLVTTGLLSEHYNDLLFLYRRAKLYSMSQSERLQEIERLEKAPQTEDNLELLKLAKTISNYVDQSSKESVNSSMNIKELYQFLEDLSSSELDEEYAKKPLTPIYSLTIHTLSSIQDAINEKVVAESNVGSVPKNKTSSNNNKNRYAWNKGAVDILIKFINDNPDYFQNIFGDRGFVARKKEYLGDATFEKNALLRFAESDVYKQHRTLILEMRKFINSKRVLNQEYSVKLRLTLGSLFGFGTDKAAVIVKGKVSDAALEQYLLKDTDGQALGLYIYRHLSQHKIAASDFEFWKENKIGAAIRDVHSVMAFQGKVMDELMDNADENFLIMQNIMYAYYQIKHDNRTFNPLIIASQGHPLIYNFFGKDKVNAALAGKTRHEQDKYIANMVGVIYFKLFVHVIEKGDLNDAKYIEKLQGVYQSLEGNEEARTSHYIRSAYEYLGHKLGYKKPYKTSELQSTHTISVSERALSDISKAIEEHPKDAKLLMNDIEDLTELLENYINQNSTVNDEDPPKKNLSGAELSEMQTVFRDAFEKILELNEVDHHIFFPMPSREVKGIDRIKALYTRSVQAATAMMNYQELVGPTGPAFKKLQEEFWKSLSEYIYAGCRYITNNNDLKLLDDLFISKRFKDLPMLTQDYNEKCSIRLDLDSSVITQRSFPNALGIDVNPFLVLGDAGNIIMAFKRAVSGMKKTDDTEILQLAVMQFPKLAGEEYLGALMPEVKSWNKGRRP